MNKSTTYLYFKNTYIPSFRSVLLGIGTEASCLMPFPSLVAIVSSILIAFWLPYPEDEPELELLLPSSITYERMEKKLYNAYSMWVEDYVNTISYTFHFPSKNVCIADVRIWYFLGNTCLVKRKIFLLGNWIKFKYCQKN